MTWVGGILCCMNPFQLVSKDFVGKPFMDRYVLLRPVNGEGGCGHAHFTHTTTTGKPDRDIDD
jgi:hypothetical protein